jgi:hypothetical protein
MITVTGVPLPTEATDAAIKQYLADCVQVVRNKQPRDNCKLFDRLMKESYGGKPSRVFEYVPCKVSVYNTKLPMTSESRVLQTFGFKIGNAYYTNARELLNWGWSWDEMLGTVDFTNYRTVRVIAPYFIYGQLSTHNQITSVCHSNRYTASGLGYWVPAEIEAHLTSLGYDAGEQWDILVEAYPPSKLQSYMKRKGVKRREVFARGSDMLAYRPFTLGGYTSNPNAWPHFIDQRMRDPHTQVETVYATKLIKKEIEK